MDIHVRGSLGTQIFELFTGLARFIEKGRKADRICINTTGVVDHARVDYLSELFDLPYPVEIVEGAWKSSFWSAKNIALVQKHKDVIRSEYCKLKHHDCLFASKVMHFRTGDRQTLSDKEYQLLSEHEGRPDVLASHQKLARSLFPENPLLDNGSAVGDWNSLLRSKEVACSFSVFPLATLLFDPSKTIRMYFGQKFEFKPGFLEPLGAIAHYYPNVAFMDVYSGKKIDPTREPGSW